MSPPTANRLAELFVRYWDNNLSAAESQELQSRLNSDSAAREEFQILAVQAVASVEHSAPHLPTSAIADRFAAAQKRRWTRRKALSYIGGGVAASVLAAAIGRRYWLAEATTPIRLTATNGEVTLRDGDGKSIVPDGPVPPDSLVSTIGPTSSAVLSYPDGSDVALTGDSVLSVAANGKKLQLHRGTATANVLPQPAGADPLSLGTRDATASRLSNVVMTLGRALQSTEVGVQSGRVSVDDSGGEPLEIVHGGEFLTVQADGNHRKKPIEPAPEKFAWDLSRPLPQGWNVGVREVTREGPIVRPVLWFDPYHKAEMYQIRSDQQWASGFFRLMPDTVFRVRYWVERPAPSQLCVCVRTDRSSCSETGMLECNGAFLRARPREWQTLEVRAGDMLDNKHTPAFHAPWVGFLVIFNTYKEDLGLKISKFEVVPSEPVLGP
jgi:ferric-dicitrate binding protein FerR (iron transport regulator)